MPRNQQRADRRVGPLGGSAAPGGSDPVRRNVVAEIRSFKLRQGRFSASQSDALGRLWPQWGVAVSGGLLDLPALFGRVARVVLEIGFGMGEATVAFAAAEPQVDVLAVEVHTPGVGKLLWRAEQAGLTQVRVAHGDARTLLRDRIPVASLAEVRVFFPDPWPKTRHLKRRLVTQEFGELVAARLRAGGRLWVATDHGGYAAQIRRVLGECSSLTVMEDQPWRPDTRFAEQARAAGRRTYDITARRC